MDRGIAALFVVFLLAACGMDAAGPGDDLATGEPDAVAGQALFASNCAVCHGEDAAGAPTGPPLVHELYVPSHHADEAFQLAVARGVEPHHWDFGAMPPVRGLDRAEVADITAHVRDLQREAGIID